MRVALLASGMIPVPPPGYGAVEKHVHHLREALERAGHEVTLHADVVGPSSGDEYRFAWRAMKRLRDENHDVVHAHTTGVAATLSAFAPRWRRGGRPAFVYTSHSRHWMSVEGWRERAGFLLERRAVRKADRVIALTQDVVDAMGPGARTTVIPNGVDAELYAPDWSARTGRVILCLGAVTAHKGMHLVAQAARGLDCEVRIVGPLKDVAYADRLEAEGAQVLGVLGEDELRRELARADVFAHLSTSEAFSLAVLEGMASGLPLVASDVCRGQVFDGGNGRAIPTRLPETDRVERARRAFTELLGDAALRKRWGERSREVVLERYTWDRVAERVAQVYADAVASR